MDYNTLVNEIVKRVSQKLNEFENQTFVPECKSKVLILNSEHGSLCHKLYEAKKLNSCCEVDCALEQNYNVDVEKYDAVVLFDFSVELLCRLAGGICDTPFSALAQKAILLDKKIYVPKEGVELFNYAAGKKNDYYDFLEHKLQRLSNCGITICPCEEIEDNILKCCKTASGGVKVEKSNTNINLSTVKFTKKVITEKDMAGAKAEKAGTVCVAKKAIITDLAKDYAKKYSLAIVRDDV